MAENAFPDAHEMDQMALDTFWMSFDQLKDILKLKYIEDHPTDDELILVSLFLYCQDWTLLSLL